MRSARLPPPEGATNTTLDKTNVTAYVYAGDDIVSGWLAGVHHWEAKVRFWVQVFGPRPTKGGSGPI
jgi:hypothetical protein